MWLHNRAIDHAITEADKAGVKLAPTLWDYLEKAVVCKENTEQVSQCLLMHSALQKCIHSLQRTVHGAYHTA